MAWHGSRRRVCIATPKQIELGILPIWTNNVKLLFELYNIINQSETYIYNPESWMFFAQKHWGWTNVHGEGAIWNIWIGCQNSRKPCQNSQSTGGFHSLVKIDWMQTVPWWTSQGPRPFSSWWRRNMLFVRLFLRPHHEWFMMFNFREQGCT